MKFAINYSKTAKQLLVDGKIQFDLFKCPDWPELLDTVGQIHPLYVHFSLRAGKGRVETVEPNFLADMLKKTGTQNINIHLGPSVSDFAGMMDHTQTPQEVETLSRTMLADIAWVADRFGPERVILENCPWSPHPNYRIPAAVLRAEFITNIVRESGCGLLLDITHALIAAKWLEQDVYEYLESLPWDVMKEIHISGSRFLNGDWYDHYALSEEDWTVTRWVLERIKQGDWPRPELASFEYGGIGERFEKPMDPAMMAEQTPQLYDMVKAC
jgi:uncharacterized protein (UPF0276 family)